MLARCAENDLESSVQETLHRRLRAKPLAPISISSRRRQRPMASERFTITTQRPLAQALRADEAILGQFIPLLYHYNMLQDEERVGAFIRAIQLLVQPDMHVLELGSGTGILSSFAARQGARVTSVERNPELVDKSRHFLRLNGLSYAVQVVEADAMQFVPDEPVDVVICEMLHVGLLREKQANVITEFKRNYVAMHGPKLPVFIPEMSILMVQPVEQDFNFAGYRAPVPMFQPPCLNQPRTRELSALEPYSTIAYHESIPLAFDVELKVQTRAAGYVNALRFVTQNILAVDMQKQEAVTWPNQCLVLPLEDPGRVEEADQLTLCFHYESGDSIDRLSDRIVVNHNQRRDPSRR